jgi:8-oxo-dGTP diphosphatase
MVTVDTVVFGVNELGLHVLLIKRGKEPFKGAWALPGGFVGEKETLEHAAVREVQEETGFRLPVLHPMKAYSDPERDPRGRNIAFCHLALVMLTNDAVSGGDDADEARWVPLDQDIDLAFDHADMLTDALATLQDLVLKTDLLVSILPAQFHGDLLIKLLEEIQGEPLDPQRTLQHFIETGLISNVGLVDKAGNEVPFYQAVVWE